MQPADAVKLIYQSEFGVGHLIDDIGRFEKRLLDEIASAETQTGVPLTEPIGNGMIRVMLNSADFRPIYRDKLLSACIRTAETVHGSADHFLKQLALLKSLSQKDIFHFSTEELCDYLADYETKGYPPISHSQLYHQTYHPAYRVVKGSCFDMISV